MAEYHYFVAHEFSKQETDDLRDAVENAFKGTGLRAYYADIEVRSSHILDKIKDMIDATKFGIYDISNDIKPNVFIELGYAIAKSKTFVIVCKKGTKIPADLAGIDRIEYQSYKELTSLLVSKVVHEFNRPRITISAPELTSKSANSWYEPHIKDWLAHPIADGSGKDDKMFGIQGKVYPIPKNANIKIWIFKNKIWPQIGGDVDEATGKWSGKIFLKIKEKMEEIDMGIDLFLAGEDTPLSSETFKIR